MLASATQCYHLRNGSCRMAAAFQKRGKAMGSSILIVGKNLFVSLATGGWHHQESIVRLWTEYRPDHWVMSSFNLEGRRRVRTRSLARFI